MQGRRLAEDGDGGATALVPSDAAAPGEWLAGRGGRLSGEVAARECGGVGGDGEGGLDSGVAWGASAALSSSVGSCVGWRVVEGDE